MGEGQLYLRGSGGNTAGVLERKSEGTGRVTAGMGNQDTEIFAETHLAVFDRRETFGNTSALLQMSEGYHLTKKVI
jgi:hypothetical protein